MAVEDFDATRIEKERPKGEHPRSRNKLAPDDRSWRDFTAAANAVSGSIPLETILNMVLEMTLHELGLDN